MDQSDLLLFFWINQICCPCTTHCVFSPELNQQKKDNESLVIESLRNNPNLDCKAVIKNN